jgi:hypothetical protein
VDLHFRPETEKLPPDAAPAFRARFTLNVNLIEAAIAIATRTKALDTLAMERFARATVEINQLLLMMPPERRAEAEYRAADAWASIAAMIRSFHYFDAYQAVEELPGRVRKLLLE